MTAPTQVLSEHFQERLKKRRLLGAVFTAFQFDPGFFEKEIVPVFLDGNFSHIPAIKLVQLEDRLRKWPGKMSVYYDANGLVESGDGSSKLDIRRIPVRLRTGIFHPKNVFALVEEIEPDKDGHRTRTLLVTSLSANLTRSGWWQNVEGCHVEELGEASETYLRNDLLKFFATLRKRAPVNTDHGALEQIHEFVSGTTQRGQRSSGGFLHAHFYAGDEAFIDFVGTALGTEGRNLYMEVISPYFDDEIDSAPLAALISRLQPKETRVFLPRNERGEALCNPELYARVSEQEGVSWGKLDKDHTRSGTAADAAARFVHAKVYRFFSMQPKREVIVIGSVNLTRPAHQVGGNLESALLVEIEPPKRPEFWLQPDATKPASFSSPSDGDGDLAIAETGTRLALRFDWKTETLDAFWDHGVASGAMRIESNGVQLFDIGPLPSRGWLALPATAAASITSTLRTSSFVKVVGDRPQPVTLLVQEEGMWKKPPLLSLLSVQDILRYWSLLTQDQRNEFLQSHAAEILGDAGNELVVHLRRETVETMFSRFAGTFHAFECLERSLRKALAEDNEKDALYRLFNMSHDSLGSLLRRVRNDEGQDDVEKYVITLCAKQLCRELKRDWPALWSEHRAEAKELDTALAVSDDIRAALVAKKPDEMSDFLVWFDDWFLARAKPLEATA